MIMVRELRLMLRHVLPNDLESQPVLYLVEKGSELGLDIFR